MGTHPKRAHQPHDHGELGQAPHRGQVHDQLRRRRRQAATELGIGDARPIRIELGRGGRGAITAMLTMLKKVRSAIGT
jgi:hypothetical protein